LEKIVLTASFLAHLLREAYLLKVQVHLVHQTFAVPIHIAVALAFALGGVKDRVRGEAVADRQERDNSRLALVRFVQLHRQCSEEAAYQRIATFVKDFVPLDDWSFIDSMFAHERQRLLALAQEILVADPDAIDEI
jgi:hypothetical protein